MEKQIKIMISSDDGEWGRGPIQKLSQKGAQVVFAKKDGKALLEKVKAEKPQIVLMELFMPGLDAIGVIHAAAKTPPWRSPCTSSPPPTPPPCWSGRSSPPELPTLPSPPFDQEEMADRMLSLYNGRGRHFDSEPVNPGCGCR